VGDGGCSERLLAADELERAIPKKSGNSVTLVPPWTILYPVDRYTELGMALIRASDANAAYKEVLGRRLPPAPDEAPIDAERIRELQVEILAADAEVERLKLEMALGRTQLGLRRGCRSNEAVQIPAKIAQ
jgi:hypothetical protein